MLVVNSHLKDNERNDSIEQDNEMESQVEKDHLEEGEIEEIEGGGDGKTPFKPEYQYSREELLKYSDHPLSRQRPLITNAIVDGLSCWIKSSNWNSYKRSDTPTERGDDSYKRRSNDPRERVRKEQDGIILSPQRRSFNSGCFVTVHYNSPNNVVRSQSESTKEGPVRRIGSGRIINRDWEYRDWEYRDKENNDDYPYRPAVGPSPRERDERFEMGKNYSGMSMDREVIRDVSRESLNRFKKATSESKSRRDRERMERFLTNRRRYEAEEPEWFSGPPGPPMYGYCEIPVPPVARRGPNFHVLRTVAWSPLQLPLPRPFRPPRLCVPYVKTFGGPTSQHDTIELRGFEDGSDIAGRNKGKITSKNNSQPNSKDSKSNTGSRKSSSEEISVLKGGSGEAGVTKELERDSPGDNSLKKSEIRDSSKADSELVSTEDAERTENRDFNLNLEDFLQLDNLPLLSNGTGGEGNQPSSRFSQWFRRDSPPETADNRRTSSAYDELIKNMINDMNESSINIPTMKESDAYFAPISPAGTTSGNSFLDMLRGNQQRNEQRSKPPSIKDLEATGKVTSVEELEARMRQGAVQSHVNQGSQNQSKKGSSSSKKEEDMIAFKKLLKQVNEGGATLGAVNDPAACATALIQMLNKPPEPSDLMGQTHHLNTAPQMHMPQDMTYKLLQLQEQQRQLQQQQELNKLWLSGGRLAPPHLHGTLSPPPTDLQLFVPNSQPSAELLSRPEAQAILQGLRQGEITPQHIVQQLQDPAMQPRHREVLASILKICGGSPRPASPMVVPQDASILQQLMLQPRIASPLPPMHNGLTHRVPSSRELTLHTQSILQTALIKKKLEEQQESFRKRQEVQRVNCQNIAANVKSSNPSTSNNAKNTGSNNQTTSATSNINNNINNSAANNVNISNSNYSNNSNSNVNSNNNNANMPAATGTSSNSSNSSSSTTATKSPTPLAFTPTSVLRKMTAEQQQQQQQQQQQPQSKDGDGNRNKFELIQTKLRQNELLKIQAAQSSRFLANSQLLELRAPQQQWSVQKQPFQQSMQQGRAIVKGSGSYQGGPPSGTGLIDIPYGNSGSAVYPERSKLTMETAPLAVQPNLSNSFVTSANRDSPNRGRAIVKGSGSYQSGQPSGTGQIDLSYGNSGRGVYPERSKLTMATAPLGVQPNFYNSFPTSANRGPPNRDIRNPFHQFLPGSGGDGELSNSPTASNQLAHWFTPELLAQAQAQTRSGKADSTLNMVSVEELERIQQNSAPVLN